jgi:hypothetical protein
MKISDAKKSEDLNNVKFILKVAVCKVKSCAVSLFSVMNAFLNLGIWWIRNVMPCC